MMEASPIGYVLKRFPRLSETFILNEIRALERLGVPLHIFSLLRPEGTLVHPAVADVRAPVTYLPERWFERLRAIVGAHAAVAWASPLRYGQALAMSLFWALRSHRPLSVMKQFARSGYVALGCRRHGVRHVHAHFAHGPSTVARLASIMLNIPFSFTTHAKDLYLTPPVTMRRRIGHARFVITCTAHNVEYLRDILAPADREKVHLVYHGIDVSEFPYPPGAGAAQAGGHPSDADTPLILAVARMVPKKGLADLIAACRALSDRKIGFRCVIIGDGPLRDKLLAEIRRLDLEDVVAVPGAIAHDKLVALYGRARVFALSPHVADDGDRDGIPNVLLEAMAAGVPVVTTSISGIPELIDDGRTGRLVPPRNPSALADAIAGVLNDPISAGAVAAAARRHIESNFSCWETTKAVQALLENGQVRGTAADVAQLATAGR